MNKSMTVQETDRFTIASVDGRQFEVVETSRIVRFRLASGEWTPPTREGGELNCGRLPVNELDGGEYEVLTNPPVRCRRV